MWIPLTFLCAFFFSLSDVFSKLALRRFDLDQVAWARFVFSLPFLLFFLPFSTPPSAWGPFLFYLACAIPLELVSALLYNEALKRSPLSLTVPFLAFTPVCIILAGVLVLGEKPTVLGMSGVVLVAAGAWVLSTGKGPAGIFGPLKNLAREPGSVMMLGVAVIYAFTATLGKKLILLSSPLFQASSYAVAMAAVMMVYALGRRTRLAPLFKSGVLWGVGGSWALMAVFHVIAIAMAQAAYMMALKRTSLLFSVLFGLWLFKEGGARHRVPGALLMLAGVFFLAMA